MKQTIQLRLGQSLTMTPQLQQAIRLLQLSTLDLQAEIQQAPKREGRNMIMFLSPRKTPLAKEKEAEAAASKAVRTIETPRQAAAKAEG